MKQSTFILHLCSIVLLLPCMLPSSFTTSVQARQLDTKSPPDSALAAMSRQMFDSTGTPGFFKLYHRGLKEAIAKKHERYEYVFRTGLLSHYSVLKQKDRYSAASDSLLLYYQKLQNERMLYRVWTNKVNTIQSWGDHAEAVIANQQMADYAQKHNQPMGIANANYYFARNYHNNRQIAEAISYYNLALSQFVELGMPGDVFNCGIDLMVLKQNNRQDADALALSDTLPQYIRASELENGIPVNPVFRAKLARLRLQSFCALKDIKRATAERDSMVRYNNIYPDKNMQTAVQWALARYAQFTGDLSEAKRILKELEQHYEEPKSYTKLAEVLAFLAEVETQQRDYAAATQSYYRYVAFNDSANIQSSTEQLNRLTKQFHLNELEQENRVVEAELHETRTLAWSSGIIAVLVVFLCLSLLFYLRQLRRKNHALYHQKQKQAEEALDKIIEQKQAEYISDKEMLLFVKIRQLLKDREVLAQPSLDRSLLAEKLNTNYTYISKAVQVGAGMNVNRYIRQARIDYACELLRKKGTPYSIAEVQEMCGFQSSTSFNRTFKDVTQMTPTNFQKLAAHQ